MASASRADQVRCTLACASALWVIGLAAILPGQALPQGPFSHTVRIDATVVDARGSRIANLTAADFDVREDGKPVSIDEVRYVSAGATVPGGSAEAPQPVLTGADEEREARRPGTRVLAVYIDEYHITAGASADRAREALLTLVDRVLAPGDLLFVMKPLDSLFAIRLTHDRDAAKRIITGLEGRRNDYTPKTPYEQTTMVGSPARIETARTQVAVSALNALALHMGGLTDGRKALLVVTEGLTKPTRRRGQEYLATIEGATRSANRSNVSIYPIDPRPAPGDAATDDERAVATALAADTDGHRVVNASDLSLAVGNAVRDSDSYYLISYSAQHREDGAFHPVQVSVKRAGAVVRARAGFWAPSADDRLKAELIARASRPLPPIKYEPPQHRSPYIQPWFGVARGPGRTTRVSFVWEPAVVVPGDRGRRVATRLELTVLDGNDEVVFKGPVVPGGPGLFAEQGDAASRVSFDVPPSRLRLRMSITDSARREIDTDVRDLLIRDLRTGVSIGTPEVLRARTARELRAIAEDVSAIPVAAREFSRTERLIVRFPVYAPEGQQRQATARLLNRSGQPMRALDLRTISDGREELELPLAGLASAEYQLELSAQSAAGQAREVLTFRVTS